jgi:phage shock protein B
VGELVPIIAILMVFGTPIAIVWLILRHRERARQHERGLGISDNGANAEMAMLADKLERRVEALETILDAEVPGWRKRHE